MMLLLGTAFLGLLIWYFLLKPMQYWKRLGVVQTNPIPLFGDSWRILFRTMNTKDFVEFIYNLYPTERVVGFYNFTMPTLLLRDPELIKQIGIKDFEHFADHPPLIDPEADPLWSKNLLSLSGAKWREMRRLLSPTFTSSKIKAIYVTMEEAARNFATYFKERKDEGIIELEVKDIFTRFTNDIIATTAFGVQVDSVREPNNTFYLMGKKMTDFSGFLNIFRFLIGQILPKFAKACGFRVINAKSAEFFSEVIDESVKQRENNQIKRHDMIDLLLEARKKQESIDGNPITNLDITSQACIFFFGGFETVANVMTFGAYELATNRDVQDKLREEIKTNVSNDGKVSYETLQEMKYMDMVISEILRKWPPFPVTDRICTKPYTIKALDKNSKDIPILLHQEVQIPACAIQNDPKYFPNPQKFDPERFSEKNAKNIVPYSYLPFGIGPRICIGNRLSLTEVKLMFFYLLLNCEIVTIQKTMTPPILTKDIFASIEGGAWLGIKYLK
ncbi:cytochrome P450 9e2-like isoform X1 [Anthonomus grandis grandis]|uniref:cytochrome P450 9e2-like isoform X1 n=1 Tax=Anthonomus grandis grandis TaxID=2921223 RepID=UPI002165408E|nr:cytochrome P450 9e2-like isoform X1 [Anthonomus grandis grandis]